MKGEVLLLALLLPSPLLAQGLGDTAARERQKRAEKAPAPPPKVFTDADLPATTPADKAMSSRGAPSESGHEGSSGVADSSSPGPDAAPRGDNAAQADPYEKERQERKLLEAEWRVRFANAREQLAIAEAHSWQEVVRTEFYQGIPVQMKVKEQIQTSELKQARQALADLTEEFRHTGLPPGWARE
jgi:hypothetical protein